MKKLACLLFLLTLPACSMVENLIPRSHPQYNNSFDNRRPPMENTFIARGGHVPEQKDPYEGMYRQEKGIRNGMDNKQMMQGGWMPPNQGNMMHGNMPMNQGYGAAPMGRGMQMAPQPQYQQMPPQQYRMAPPPQQQRMMYPPQGYGGMNNYHHSPNPMGRMGSLEHSQSDGRLALGGEESIRRRPAYNSQMDDQTPMDGFNYYDTMNSAASSYSPSDYQQESKPYDSEFGRVATIASPNMDSNRSYYTDGQQDFVYIDPANIRSGISGVDSGTEYYQQYNPMSDLDYYSSNRYSNMSVADGSSDPRIRGLIDESQNIDPSLKDIPPVPDRFKKGIQRRRAPSQESSYGDRRPVDLLVSLQ